MTEEEIAVELNHTRQEFKTVWHTIDELKEQGHCLNDLAVSVKVLATNMSHMAEEQREQGERLKNLESVPIEDQKGFKQTVRNCIVSGVIGAIISAVMALVLSQ